MKCKERVSKYCRQAITYKKYAEIRKCNKCCIGCLELCGNVCNKALDINKSELK